MKQARLLPAVVLLSLALTAAGRAESDVLPGTEPLAWTGDLSAKMVDGAHRYLDRKLAASVESRQRFWRRDFSSPQAYERSVAGNRERLKKYIGLVDERLPIAMERVGNDRSPALVAETDRFRAYQVRWPVLRGVWGEGLLLEPKGKIAGHVVAVPDADQTPEQIVGLAAGVAGESQLARRLAENGFQVLVPVLIDRTDRWSGNRKFAMTNQPHREWIYRQAFEMGRHIIGYEVQKVLAAVDWFSRDGAEGPIGVVGYGEGGLIAFYAAAVDRRIDACLVSGYFDSRQRVWDEPIYRNVWGLLHEFGDAEIAGLILPRGLVVEHSELPKVDGPPAGRESRRTIAAPGRLRTPPLRTVAAELGRVSVGGADGFQRPVLVSGTGGATTGPGSPKALKEFARLLGVEVKMTLSAAAPVDRREPLDPAPRQRRQVEQLTDHIQLVMRNSDHVRDDFYLNQVSRESVGTFVEGSKRYKQHLWDEVIGRLDDPLLAAHPRSRKIYDEPTWTGYEVVLDVWPDVFAWGILCLPKDIKPGERRPVVVCQHGLEGVPSDVVVGDHRAYHDFAARLAERGFITFAPHNLYRGETRFRMLQRKANPLKASLYSIIIPQHEQIINWLETLPSVDAGRIAFYGLSYGGKTAVRVPPLVERYCLSICSADFNDWIRKNVTAHARYSYLFTREWELPEFDLGHTFNYAELSYLMVPRPFMVERGHHDGVAPGQWVAYEYAKVRWLYAQLGLADKTEIEFFNGPHTINGKGTFDFLHKHLDWPKP